MPGQEANEYNHRRLKFGPSNVLKMSKYIFKEMADCHF